MKHKCDKCGQLAALPNRENIPCIRGACNGKMKPLKSKTAPVAEVPCSDGVMLCGDLPLRKKSKEYMKQFSIDNLAGELLSRRLGYEDGYAACLRDNGLKKD